MELLRKPGRPAGIAVLAVLQFLGAIPWFALGGFIVVIGAFEDNHLDGVDLGPALVMIGAFLVAIGFAFLVVARGLWRLRRWAFVSDVALLLLAIAITVMSGWDSLSWVGVTARVMSVGLEAAVLVYFLSASVRRAFFRPWAPTLAAKGLTGEG